MHDAEALLFAGVRDLRRESRIRSMEQSQATAETTAPAGGIAGDGGEPGEKVGESPDSADSDRRGAEEGKTPATADAPSPAADDLDDDEAVSALEAVRKARFEEILPRRSAGIC